MTIADYVAAYIADNITLLLEDSAVEKCFVEAAKEYQAWAALQADTVDELGCRQQAAPVTADTEISASEWGVIQVLAHLLCERENALIQESSRVASHEPYGRSSSEVEADIQNFRNEHFRQWAFIAHVVTV